MSISSESRYAYAEVFEILNWLGDDYKRKIPRNLLWLIKEERKFGYRPKLDFSKPLNGQVRQETKNIIAYFETRCWLKDEVQKNILESKIRINSDMRKAELRERRREQRAIRAASVENKSLSDTLNAALKDLNKPS